MSNLSYYEMRLEMCKVAKMMWDRRLTNAAGGNFAVRVDENRILISPSLMSERKHCEMQPEDFLLIDYDRNIIEGLKTGADEYIVKPFNIGILRATISNILTNRSLLRHKYANLELNDDEDATTCTNCSTDLDWKFISSVKKHVEENMDNGALNVEMLCSLLNMSRTSFYNKIKALTDQAPADYIRLIRLKRAAQLLKEQKYSITEVAEMTGFSDAKYFREVFKKHFSVIPSQYAKQKEEGE